MQYVGVASILIGLCFGVRGIALLHLESLEQITEQDLVFTLPAVLSESDAKIIREKIVQLLEEIKNTSKPAIIKIEINEIIFFI